MELDKFLSTIGLIKKENRYFMPVSFGCRVNAAESNHFSQILVDNGFEITKNPDVNFPDVIIVNTCSITKKGEIESLSRVRVLQQKYPKAIIIVSGCANLKKIESLPNVFILDNPSKEKILEQNDCLYTSKIGDKFSHTNRYLLKIQSGCTQFCSYCTVPYKRQYLWSLDPQKAVNTVKEAVNNGYKEIIITGVNLEQYQYGLSNLVEKLLSETGIELISFGSIPINCIDGKFIDLLSTFNFRLSDFLHIPIQSGSDKILKLMKRPYNREKVLKVFNDLQSINYDQKFGTDIIVGFPGETDKDFKDTLTICQQIGFTKIHTFRYSSRPNTLAKYYYNQSPKINIKILADRSRQIRKAILS